MDALARSLTSLKRGPEFLQVDGLAVSVGAERLGIQVDIDLAGEREGDDERRRHEEVGLDAGMHPGLEIAVAGKHAGGDEIGLGDGLVDHRD